jgi:hypothetical protein
MSCCAYIDTEDISGNCWSSSTSASSILMAANARCSQQHYHVVAQLIGVCRRLILKSLWTCDRNPGPRAARSRRISHRLVWQIGKAGMHEEVGCIISKQAWTMCLRVALYRQACTIFLRITMCQRARAICLRVHMQAHRCQSSKLKPPSAAMI